MEHRRFTPPRSSSLVAKEELVIGHRRFAPRPCLPPSNVKNTRCRCCSRGDSTTVLVVCSLFLGCGRLVAYRASSLYTVYATFFFIISSLGTSNTVLTEAATRVSDEDAGGVFGALTAVEAAAGMVGPVLGGYLAGLGEEVPIGFVVLVYFLCACWVKARFENHFGILAEAKKMKMKKKKKKE